MLPANQDIIRYGYIYQFPQFLCQQTGLVVTALSQSFPVQRYWHQYVEVQRAGAEVFLQHSGQGNRQSPQVLVFELVDCLAHNAFKAKWRADTVYGRLPPHAIGAN
jgi:hypothetical protein